MGEKTKLIGKYFIFKGVRELITYLMSQIYFILSSTLFNIQSNCSSLVI